MTRVACVKLQYNPRVLWFDPQDLDIKKDDPVVVKTARGTELGYAARDIVDVDEEEIKRLKSPLKPVLRLADEKDLDQAEKMRALSQEALPVFKEMAAETSTDMRPVSVEYLLDGDRAVFYFESEERVDFRELVRRLASHFHVRIDMRQIGVRDEACMLGGLGHCGQELCCCRLGGEFCPVSIRMAKEQDLSLNPQKISGICGRLMCCLRYEYDTYKDFKSRAPKHGATIETPEGQAKVVELYMPKEQVSIKTEEGKIVKIPLDEMEQDDGAARPNRVSAETFELYANRRVVDTFGDQPLITPAFTGKDKLGDSSVRRTDGREQEQVESQDRRSSRSGASKTAPSSRRKPRRRTAVKGGQAQTSADQSKTQQNQNRKKPLSATGNSQYGQQNGRPEKPTHTASQQERSASVRPGQKSSGLRGGRAEAHSKSAGGSARTSAPKSAHAPKAGQQTGQRGGDAHRTARRRSHKARGQGAESSQAGQGTDEA